MTFYHQCSFKGNWTLNMFLLSWIFTQSTEKITVFGTLLLQYQTRKTNHFVTHLPSDWFLLVLCSCPLVNYSLSAQCSDAFHTNQSSFFRSVEFSQWWMLHTFLTFCWKRHLDNRPSLPYARARHGWRPGLMKQI